MPLVAVFAVLSLQDLARLCEYLGPTTCQAVASVCRCLRWILTPYLFQSVNVALDTPGVEFFQQCVRPRYSGLIRNLTVQAHTEGVTSARTQLTAVMDQLPWLEAVHLVGVAGLYAADFDRLLFQHCFRLKRVEIWGSNAFTYDSQRAVLPVRALADMTQLRALGLGALPALTGPMWDSIFQGCPQLVSLTLRDNNGNTAAQAIARHGAQLRELHLGIAHTKPLVLVELVHRCRYLRRVGFYSLRYDNGVFLAEVSPSTWPHLQHLDLRGSKVGQPLPAPYHQQLWTSQWTHLSTLRMKFLEVDDLALAAIPLACPVLEEMTMFSCRATSVGFQHILAQCHNLRVFRLGTPTRSFTTTSFLPARLASLALVRLELDIQRAHVQHFLHLLDQLHKLAVLILPRNANLEDFSRLFAPQNPHLLIKHK
ncbi:hypothetical protein H4R34_004003 [Dimargaris verticillata]|uniref:F-box domain-containing protein n=1 Tax=Dimargaris verticillata TaxID=2761393 RepID=A0A9W8B559_9FUNG|nr:hypothetical protein H4R34_004003 [Dimargaris verticillata]